MSTTRRGLHRIALGGVGALLLVLMVAPVMSAGARPNVQVKGTCSAGPAITTLKVAPDNARLEVDFSMDEARAGSTWMIVLKHNGVRFWHTQKVALPDGSWDVHQFAKNLAGTDTFFAKATNVLNGQLCTAVAKY